MANGSPEILDFLLTRRSVTAGKMKEPGPSEDELRTILQAGIRVPDHGKLGPWRFIVIRGEARAQLGDALADAYAKANPEANADAIEHERNRFTRAPMVVAVTSQLRETERIPEWEQVLSCGAVCQNMLHAAHASGFVAQWLTEWYAYDDDVKAALNVEPGHRIAGFVYIGSAAEPPKDRVRPELSDVVSEWRPRG